ncbi:hypothetical protein Nepgr_027582 [Nepenthes gracilis]|uniref:Phospholipid/glycerol acyltransferase domain-containing protein n=1 Tax=Nepenthes gracilis TaxID=150966 RepID=A0AAD3Y391_NEPGR|nr:hypothetical protein Nepgr_027582 [Nepenthes gracilis]
MPASGAFRNALNFFSHMLRHKHHRISYPRNPQGKLSNSHASKPRFQFKRHSSLVNRTRAQLSNHAVIFSMEEGLLRSSSLFPYFMLVAFEAGCPLRALVLLVLYPLICMVGKEMGLKIMVMICFLGKREENFNAGRSVLPKFFLEDVGMEGFEAVSKCKRKVGVSCMPRVMVECFLRDYLEIDHVVGRELKVFCGHFVGLMEQKSKDSMDLEEVVGEENIHSDVVVVGICGPGRSLDHQSFSTCKEIYRTSKEERSKWTTLPREKYPKPLIFHDSRLVSRPTATEALAIFMWIPFAIILFVTRTLIIVSLPKKVARPFLAFLGARLLISKAKPIDSELPPPPLSPPSQPSTKSTSQGMFYVCNHRNLCDPVYIKMALHKEVTAVTYRISKISEIISPIKTVRLRRQREEDAMIMEKMLNQGDVVICPEGTTCREPYLLRFSPLFAEQSVEIVPVAINTRSTMFYANTANGLKFFDPIFFLMEPHPSYTIKLLHRVKGSPLCHPSGGSSIDVANDVQNKIATALGFRCTRLTRKEKYSILVGNDGVSSHKRQKQVRAAESVDCAAREREERERQKV